MQKRQYTIISTFLFLLILMPCSVMSESALTIFYAGEEQGQLGLHGCGSEQVGGLAHRHTLIDNLHIRHPSAVLDIHTGNLIDVTDPNAEWVYQIGLSALEAMDVDILCLGPNELSLSSENLASIHANYPEIVFICTNSKQGIEKSYLIKTVGNVNVAVVNLISLSHAEGLPNVSLKSPQTVLAELKSELVKNSDIVVVVFHGTQEKAYTLSEANAWIDILIVVGNHQKNIEGIHRPSVFTDKMAHVTNVSEGAAVGVLEVNVDSELNRYIFTNSFHGVSEEIVPDADLAQLIEGYEASVGTGTEETFKQNTTDVPKNAIHITYFHKKGCQKCSHAVKVLKTLQIKYPNIVIEQRNAQTEQTLLESMGILYKVSETKRLTTPAVFIGNTAIVGELDEQQLENIIQKHLKIGVTSRVKEAEAHLGTAESEIINRFHGFGILTVAGAGLLDGINPCAFATIVFFISYMNLVGRGRKEMLIAGGAFTFAVFTTYLLLGLGTLSFMKFLNKFSGVATCVYLFAALLTFGLAGLSLYDAIKAKQGKTKEIFLQLPLVLKQRIHKVIREQTRTSGVIIGAIVIGFVISALELVCTGQVYLPTLTFVAGVDGMRGNAIAYLLLYNLMFIVPLLVVFGCVYWGTTSEQLGGVLQRHLVTVKVAIGILLFGLGTWLVLIII